VQEKAMGVDIDTVLTSPGLRATGDQLWDPESLPWVPQADGVYFRLLRVSPLAGSWTNLLRISKRGTVSLHRHLGQVEAWVINGEWRYLEHDWVARAGTFVLEPPGDIHTLVNVGDTEMVTLFVVHGPIEYLGPDGRVAFTETAATKLARYADFCQANGIPLAPILT
jgi:2,4'-dihydroxyacetophenone dioxygenase